MEYCQWRLRHPHYVLAAQHELVEIAFLNADRASSDFTFGGEMQGAVLHKSSES